MLSGTFGCVQEGRTKSAAGAPCMQRLHRARDNIDIIMGIMNAIDTVGLFDRTNTDINMNMIIEIAAILNLHMIDFI